MSLHGQSGNISFVGKCFDCKAKTLSYFSHFIHKKVNFDKLLLAIDLSYINTRPLLQNKKVESASSRKMGRFVKSRSEFQMRSRISLETPIVFLSSAPPTRDRLIVLF